MAAAKVGQIGYDGHKQNITNCLYMNYYLFIFETNIIVYATLFNPLHMALKSLVLSMQALDDGNSSM